MAEEDYTSNGLRFSCLAWTGIKTEPWSGTIIGISLPIIILVLPNDRRIAQVQIADTTASFVTNRRTEDFVLYERILPILLNKTENETGFHNRIAVAGWLCLMAKLYTQIIQGRVVVW